MDQKIWPENSEAQDKNPKHAPRLTSHSSYPGDTGVNNDSHVSNDTGGSPQPTPAGGSIDTAMGSRHLMTTSVAPFRFFKHPRRQRVEQHVATVIPGQTQAD